MNDTVFYFFHLKRLKSLFFGNDAVLAISYSLTISSENFLNIRNLPLPNFYLGAFFEQISASEFNFCPNFFKSIFFSEWTSQIIGFPVILIPKEEYFPL